MCAWQVFLAEWMGTQVAAKQLLSFQNKAKDEVCVYFYVSEPAQCISPCFARLCRAAA